MIDLPFQYLQRWGQPQLAEDLLSGDRALVDRARGVLEQRDRDLEDYLGSLPTDGGGAPIYCVVSEANGGDVVKSISLTARSTVQVTATCVSNANNASNETNVVPHVDSSDSWFASSPYARTVNAANGATTTTALTFVTTLDAGTYDIGVKVSSTGASIAMTSVSIVVGSNTENDCLEIGS